jgi:hypothetical protein
MNFSKFNNLYWTRDGVIKSFHLDIPNSIAEIELSVHKREIGKALSNSTNDKELLPCNVRLTFRYLIEVSLFDKFPSDGYYVEFITGYNINGGEVCLSINLFDNSSHVYERPNWVIRAKRVSWQEI